MHTLKKHQIFYIHKLKIFFFHFIIYNNGEVIRMFELADNKKIGLYLKSAILDTNRYTSVRKFAEACLVEMNVPNNLEEIRNMSNRLSQIINGKKSIQLTDLPVFTKLLNMSCEEILSAGKCKTTTFNHLTNYNIATSNDQNEWEKYIKRDEQLILNADEYGKTVIEYALEFENYDFVKFLMKHNYIWFVGTDEFDLLNYSFGAGTSIERNPLLMKNMNLLNSKMQERYDLRMKMITLAIKHNDIKMLNELHAREIPTFYQISLFAGIPTETNKYFDNDLITALSNADDSILEYFSEEFDIVDNSDRIHHFIFPFIGTLIESLVESKNDLVQQVLKDTIKHNQYVFNKLSESLDETVESYRKTFRNSTEFDKGKDDIINKIMYDIEFYDEDSIIRYRNILFNNKFVTNIIKVNATSDDVKTNCLIRELNDLYYKVQNITPIV